MKRSADETIVVNKIAKSIKDSFDPFREDVHDGSMWQRLLAVVRSDLNKRGNFDFSALNNFEFDTRCVLDGLSVKGYLALIKKNLKRSR